ncbi:RNA-guided endonuclease InsQ/TnpB family protein, partial [Psychromonas sp. MB-3u-54]|uniref:RNA-guided endonuclease InsQ/TnpB family protein n=1 Tax=Psychromonas sp. MB-3u-54 TaxID=2058319 RepID=UPI001E3A8043
RMKKKAYKFRFYPTDDQASLLAKTFGCVRFIYNRVLKVRTDAYYKDGKSINYSAASKILTELKKDPEFIWLKEVASVALQQSLRHQQTAFTNFWDGRTKYPTFKKKNARQSFSLVGSAFRYRDGNIYIPKSNEPLNIRWSQPLPCEPSTITISKDAAGRYFISCRCDVDIKPMPISAKQVGIDLGLTDLYITSDGFKSGNPRHLKRYEAKLAYFQRMLSRKKKGSKNRNKMRLKVARVHAKIADCRMDATHKASRKLINENQVVCVENLAVKNMMKVPTLAKAIADANWGEFVRQLHYKGGWAGRSVVEVDRWFPSSKRCSTESCGFVNESLPLNVRRWTCPKCGSHHDRDINAAKNIKAVGLTVLASGATGSGAKV